MGEFYYLEPEFLFLGKNLNQRLVWLPEKREQLVVRLEKKTIIIKIKHNSQYAFQCLLKRHSSP